MKSFTFILTFRAASILSQVPLFPWCDRPSLYYFTYLYLARIAQITDAFDSSIFSIALIMPSRIVSKQASSQFVCVWVTTAIYFGLDWGMYLESNIFVLLLLCRSSSNKCICSQYLMLLILCLLLRLLHLLKTTPENANLDMSNHMDFISYYNKYLCHSNYKFSTNLKGTRMSLLEYSEYQIFVVSCDYLLSIVKRHLAAHNNISDYFSRLSKTLIRKYRGFRPRKLFKLVHFVNQKKFICFRKNLLE